MSGRYIPYSERTRVDRIPGVPALAMRDVKVTHPGAEKPALNDLTLEVEAGSRVALVGPNGAGKSTLLKAVAGLLPPRAGEIRIYGQPVGACHHRVAYLAQRSTIAWDFPVTVRRLVMMGRYVHLGWLRWPRSHDWAIVDEILEQLGIADLAGRQISQLSGGQQQRALLARALAQEADLLLLDEPLTAVDIDTRQVLMDVLTRLMAKGKTMLMATHELGQLAADFDQAVYLDEGQRVPPSRPASGQLVPAEVDSLWSG